MFAKNSFYIASLKEIMLEAILILNMDPRFREDDSGGDSHFHGNDRHKQNRHGLCPIKQTKSVPFSWQ
jgi:hypothetical protein